MIDNNWKYGFRMVLGLVIAVGLIASQPAEVLAAVDSSPEIILYCYETGSKSDGNADEKSHISKISLPPEAIIKEGGSTTLQPVIIPKDAYYNGVTWETSEPGIVSVDENGIVTGIKEGTAIITATAEVGGDSASCEVRVIDYVDPGIKNPKTEGDISTDDGYHTTWDCIWFGDYWQEDTNGDGCCFSSDVIKGDDGKYYQNGKEISGFGGDRDEYPADSRQPVKWRVLDIDASGNALLIADKLIDIFRYNETDTDITWETCTLRSYLNCYGSESNSAKKDYKDDGFLKKAFSPEEQEAIFSSGVVNENNPFYTDVSGGNDTIDKIFCLSISEAMTLGYGFVKNEFPYYHETYSDPTRIAVHTSFTYLKPGYRISKWWWLRSPGQSSDCAAFVGDYGAVHASNYKTDRVISDLYCVRPAFRMNLVNTSALWCYAGTVDSRGDEYMNERKRVTGVTLTSPKDQIESGESIDLEWEVFPAGAWKNAVSFTSSSPDIASVDRNGRVTGVSAGSAVITVKTNYRGFEAYRVVNVSMQKDYYLIPGEVRRLKINGNGIYTYGVRWTLDIAEPKGCISMKNGIVTAKNLKNGTSGEAAVTAEYNGRVDKFLIHINGNQPELTGSKDKKKQLKAPKTVTAEVTAKDKTDAVRLSGTAATELYAAGAVKKPVAITVSIPKGLISEGCSLTASVNTLSGNNKYTENGSVCTVGFPQYNNDHSKASFEINPVDAGAAYIVLSLKDSSGMVVSEAVTKVIVKKPLAWLSLSQNADPGSKPDEKGIYSLTLNAGAGKKLTVTGTKGNTDPKDLSFKVKQIKGNGVKVSKSGYVSAVLPGCEAEVAVRSGKVSDTIRVVVDNLKPESAGKCLIFSKPSITIKQPAPSKSVYYVKKTLNLKLAMSDKKAQPPSEIQWTVKDVPEVKGVPFRVKVLEVKDGKVTISSLTPPGCYEITATPEGGMNSASCELIVR